MGVLAGMDPARQTGGTALIKISDREVELTDTEIAVAIAFGLRLELHGESVADAGKFVRTEFPGLDESFYEWLER